MYLIKLDDKWENQEEDDTDDGNDFIGIVLLFIEPEARRNTECSVVGRK